MSEKRSSSNRDRRRPNSPQSLGRCRSSEEIAAKLGMTREQIETFIEFRHVCFSYNPDNSDTPTLDNVSLTVKAGEMIAIVGGNGSGKTTLLGLLPRFYDPDSGAVLIDGVNLRAAHSAASSPARSDSSPRIHSSSTNRCLRTSPIGKRERPKDEVIEAAKKAHAHDFIIANGGRLRHQDGRDRAANFSGGEKQRIALARAILRNPSILILDEFTSAIDSRPARRKSTTVLQEFRKGPHGIPHHAQAAHAGDRRPNRGDGFRAGSSMSARMPS